MGRFEGKVAVVTGASGGIGESIARRLAHEGARLVLIARRGNELERVCAELDASTTVAIPGSVDEPATAERAIDAAADVGGVDVLVNNAAMDHTGDVLETSGSEVRAVMETNYFGALWMLQAAGRVMRQEGGGSIVNITSRLASIGIPSMAHYAASKGALLALTRNAAVELASSGIRVNAVAPAFVETPLFRDWLREQDDPEASLSAAQDAIPQQRLARPEEVAAAVAFLASDEAAHITGASLAVDGGYTAA